MAAVKRCLWLQPESLLDLTGAFEWREHTGVDFEVITYVRVHALILPARQARQPVRAPGFAGFQDVQRRHDAHQMEIEGRQQFDIVRYFAAARHVVDDQVVALPGHGGNGVAHAAQGFAHRSGPDHDRRLAVPLNGFVGETIGMVLQGIGQHLENCSIWTCRNGAAVIVCNALAIELLPALPTPLRTMILAIMVNHIPGFNGLPVFTTVHCRTHGTPTNKQLFLVQPFKIAAPN